MVKLLRVFMNDTSIRFLHKAGIPQKTIGYYRIRLFRDLTPRDFLFFVMDMETKYVWDIAVESKYSKKKRELADQVSQMISGGGEVRDMQKKLQLLHLL